MDRTQSIKPRTRQEAEQAVREDFARDSRAWFESLPEPKLEFTEEDERCFYFVAGDCEIGVFKETGEVVVLPT